MPKLMSWPDLLGARDANGYIVVDRKRSRSKWSNTRFVLYNPKDGGTAVRTAGQFAWAKYDAANIAILANGLREVVNRKVKVPFDRGAVAMQCVDTTLVMYETGYRGTIWPRYWWPISLSAPALSWAINEALIMETLRPDALVAFEDKRACASVKPHLPHEWKWDEKPRWTGDLNDFVDQILAKKETLAT
jgi:hypothetical protein